jgi:hypothetical protein
MKTILSIVLVSMIFLVSSCSQKVYISSSNIYGNWTGTGKFNNTKIRADVGEVIIDIEIHEDNTVTGTIGDATIIKSRIVRHVTSKEKDGNTIKCKLEGKINSDSDFSRKYFDIIMYVEGKTEIRTNFFYGRRIGGVTLNKTH